MCGIYGRWHLDGRPIDLEVVRQATASIRHRGPDDEGYFLAETAGSRRVHCAGAGSAVDTDLPQLESVRGEPFDFAFGFRRLSILDLTQCGHQPMSTADGRFTLVFNGEVYNYRELRVELRGRGHRFRGGSDTEVVLAAFAEWGPECLPRFNGMWAIAVWDNDRRRLFLSRDRFGVKPLYMAVTRECVAFASEIKALVGAGAGRIAFRPRDEAVYDFLRDGQLPSPSSGATFFQHVQALPPGHFVLVDRAGVATHQYYELPSEPRPSTASPDEVAGAYCERLLDAVRLRLRSDVPVGTCLSGGVDSSSIAALVNRIITEDGASHHQVGERQKTFSAVYESSGRYNEREYVEVVRSALGVDGTLVYPTAASLHDDLPRLVWHQDEPFGSTSIFAQWSVMKAVRERGVTVLLDGQGADETLAGYRPYDIFLADLLRRGHVSTAVAASGQIRSATGDRVGAVFARALVRQLPHGWLARLRGARSSLAVGALRPEFLQAHRDRPPFAAVNRHLHQHLCELIRETSLPHLLRYEDRNSMAFAVEGRVPFLDYRLVEYALSQAFPWAIHRGWAKWPLRAGMRGMVPEGILWRRVKVGFETPERSWLTAWVQRAGASHFGPDARSAPYLDIAAVRRGLDEYVAGGGHDRQVWRWINLELWLRAFG